MMIALDNYGPLDSVGHHSTSLLIVLRHFLIPVDPDGTLFFNSVKDLDIHQSAKEIKYNVFSSDPPRQTHPP
jgi:hypothetical protein